VEPQEVGNPALSAVREAREEAGVIGSCLIFLHYAVTHPFHPPSPPPLADRIQIHIPI
jgi:8-oxo-dGTP pyrophosphatase MutT (NUDIX family)